MLKKTVNRAAGALTFLLFVAGLNGCANTEKRDSLVIAPSPPKAESKPGLFQPAPRIPTLSELLKLSPQQSQAFLDFFHDERYSQYGAHRRISFYLEEQLLGFDYVSETRSVAQSLQHNAGNCMSLAAVTLALADLVNVDTGFQMVQTPPLYDQTRTTLITTDHVRTRLFEPNHTPEEGKISLRRPHVIVDYFAERRGIGGRGVSRQEFVTLFYRNLAVDALHADNPNLAFALATEANKHHPDHPDVLNLLAILHRRAGAPTTAEAFYLRATELHGDRIDLLSNYQFLLRTQHRDVDANALDERIARLPDDNPFHWIELGERARERGSYQRALTYFQRAIDHAPYLHQGYWRQAEVYQSLGHHHRSISAMQQALQRANRHGQRQAYKGKLRALKGH